MSIHKGHRDRMRKRFLEQGLDGFEDHQVLEMLLYYSIPQIDTNELAHTLIKKFGSLSRVMEAPVSQLTEVPGIGANSATLISFVSAMNRYCMICKAKEGVTILDSVLSCAEYLRPHFLNRRNEVVFMLCLDAKHKLLSCKMLGEGSINSANISSRKIVELAVRENATFLILAHNHPSGLALPSAEDVQTTRHLARTLQAMEIVLVDHLVFSDDDFVSIASSHNIYD